MPARSAMWRVVVPFMSPGSVKARRGPPGDGVRAAVAYEAGRPLVVEDVEPLPVGPRDVLVRIAASGICHTDLNVIEGRSALPLPIVPGHEACGTVEEVAVDVQPLRAGPHGPRHPPGDAARRADGPGRVRLRDLRRGDGRPRGVGGAR